jgi:hypothetical protein
LVQTEVGALLGVAFGFRAAGIALETALEAEGALGSAGPAWVAGWSVS